MYVSSDLTEIGVGKCRELEKQARLGKAEVNFLGICTPTFSLRNATHYTFGSIEHDSDFLMESL